MEHRRDIDGLRAIAVLPVILFHAGFDVFGGGYVGVDTFFVISGFLITSIIIGELAEGKFSIVTFYERRARRILPALFVVMAACLPVAWLWMVPEQFDRFGRSMMAVTLFASNILFWRESGYFESTAEEKPLLNMWSLAVEEQFYLFFPLLLMISWRFGWQFTFKVLIAIAVASLLLSEWGWRNKPVMNFFLIPFRAWELMAGAVCAFLLPRGIAKRNGPLAALGLGLILFAVFYFDEHAPFPSVYALVPVLGTVLAILFAAPETAVARLLSTKLLVGIGLISYSAYLWHHPIFAFARIGSSHAPGPWTMVVLIAVSFALAGLTWRFVEQPVRLRTWPAFRTRTRLFVGAATTGAALLVAGAAVATIVPPYLKLAYPELFQEDRAPAVSAAEPCAEFSPESRGDASCVRYGHGPQRIVIWGDSHAISLRLGVRSDPSLAVFVLSHSSCPPIIDVIRHGGRPREARNCRRLDETRRYAEFVKSLRPDQVFLMARWPMYLRGRLRTDGEIDPDHFITDGTPGAVDAASSQRAFVAGMKKTIDFLAAFSSVAVVEQVPELGVIGKDQRLFAPAVPRRQIDEWHKLEDAAFREVEARTPFRSVRSREWFCSATQCLLRDNGWPLYADENHLSRRGAVMLWELIRHDARIARCGEPECPED